MSGSEKPQASRVLTDAIAPVQDSAAEQPAPAEPQLPPPEDVAATPTARSAEPRKPGPMLAPRLGRPISFEDNAPTMAPRVVSGRGNDDPLAVIEEPVPAPGEPAPEEPKAPAEPGPIRVWQFARESGGSVMLDLVLEVPKAMETPVNGIILSQAIPEGWDVVQSDPPMQTFDGATRTAKWLFIGDHIANGHIVLVSSGGADTAAWSNAPASFSYRTPDGVIHTEKALRHPDSLNP